MANHYCVRFLETSAKECKNVDQAFQLMTREIKANVASAPSRRQADDPQRGATKLTGSKTLQPQKKGCC